jgi:hypothetical protein
VHKNREKRGVFLVCPFFITTLIDENRLLSGCFDKKIVLVHIGKRENVQPKPIEFKLHLQCKGMKIDGIKPDEKRKLLEKLISKASLVG